MTILLKFILLATILISCSLSLASDNNASDHLWGEFKNEKEYTDNVNKWFQDKQERRKVYLAEKRQREMALKFLIPILFVVFSVITTRIGRSKRQVVFRILTWSPLFAVSLGLISLSFYIFAALFIPLVIGLWFQREITKKELIISSSIYALSLASLSVYYMAIVALANQGAGG